MKAEKINAPFHPITAVEARQWYRDGLLTTSGYLWAIRRITCSPRVDFLIPNVVAFCDEWGISRAAFYRAVKQLDSEGYMNWEATHGLRFKDSKKVVDFPPQDKKCLASETLPHDRDTESHDRDSSSHKRDSLSHDRDSGIYMDRARSSDISDKQILSDSTAELSTLIAGLADEREREKFLEFAEQQAAKCKNPEVVLTEKWIGKNFEELHRKFKKVEAAATPASDEASQAKQQELANRRKQAKEFLSERNTDSDREAKCVPAPQKSAVQPQESHEMAEVSNQLEEGAKEPKIEGKGFGVDQKLIERLKAKSKKSPKQVTKEVVEDDRVKDAAPYD